MSLFLPTYVRATDANGNPLSGAKLYFYRTGTTTLADVYTTINRTVAHSNPVVADSAGLFASIYLDPTTTYRVVLKTSAGSTIKDTDPYNGVSSGASEIDVTDYGTVGDGVTDDTAAIQAAITDACAAGVARIIIPAGIYLVSNLILPALANTAAGMKVIEFAGPSQPSSIFGTVPGATVVSQKGAIIKSNATSGSILSVAASGGSFSFYHLVVRDINFRATDNPQVAALNAGNAIQLTAEDLQLDTGTYNMNAALPTHSGAVGIITPLIGNGALTRIRNVVVSGFYIGMDVNEHTNADDVNFASCLFAMRIQAANDASRLGRIGAYCCPTVVAVNGAHRFDIDQLMIEHASATVVATPATAWMAALEDIRDVSNLGRGSLRIDLAIGDIGPSSLNNLVFNGGTKIHISRAGDADSSAGFHSITSNPVSIPNNANTNLTWGSGSGGDSGLQIKGGDATKLQCVIPGLYEFSIRGSFAANATGSREMILGLNGAAIDTDIRPNAGAALTTTPTVRVSAVLVKNDEITVAGFQDSGGALNLTCSALLHKRIAANFTL